MFLMFHRPASRHLRSRADAVSGMVLFDGFSAMQVFPMPRLLPLLGVWLFAVILISGCAKPHTATPIAYPQTAPDDIPVIPREIADQGIQRSTLSPITTISTLPAIPEENACATSVIESTAEDGVLIQGIAYLRSSLPELYRDMTTAEVIGPRHMTNDIVQDAVVETPLETSFTLHVKVKYILTVDFDLEWRIFPVFDDGKHVGYVAEAHKTSGTRYITEITNHVQVLEVEPGLFKLEITSFNRATMDKEEEAKGYVTGLFEYWTNACHSSYTSPTADASPTETALSPNPQSETGDDTPDTSDPQASEKE